LDQLLATLYQEILLCLGPLKKTPSGWHKQNCKLCHLKGHNPDKRRRFGILYEPGQSIGVHCFNCGFSSRVEVGKTMPKSFGWFLRAIGMPEYNVKRFIFELYKQKVSPGDKPKIVLKKNIADMWAETSLPPGAKTIRRHVEEGCTDPHLLKAITYLEERRLLYPDDIYWCSTKEKLLYKYVVLPFYYQGKVVGYTKRIVGNPPSKEIPKYIHEKPLHYIYNLDKQKSSSRNYVIVAEGVLDAFLVDGISPLTNTISPEQANLINSLNKQVIVVPDHDKAGQVMIDIALQNNWAVSFPPWSKDIKDVADASKKYGRILTVQSILEHVETSQFAIKLKRKMMTTINKESYGN